MRRWGSLYVDLRHLSRDQERAIGELEWRYPTPALTEVTINGPVPSTITNVISGAGSPCMLNLWIDAETTLEENVYEKDVPCLLFLGGCPRSAAKVLGRFRNLSILILSGARHHPDDEGIDFPVLQQPIELSGISFLLVNDLSMVHILRNTRFLALRRLLVKLEPGYRDHRHPNLIEALLPHMGQVTSLGLCGLVLDSMHWDALFEATPLLHLLNTSSCSSFHCSLMGASRCRRLVTFKVDGMDTARIQVIRLFVQTGYNLEGVELITPEFLAL